MTNQPPQSIVWRDHPVIIACVAFGAGIAFAMSYFLPTHTVSLQNQIASQTEISAQEQATARKEKQQREKLEQELAAAKQRIDRLAAEVAGLQQSNLFSLGSPYPVGLGKVKIGDKIDLVSQAFPDTSIIKDKGWWDVNVEHAVFEMITYRMYANTNVIHSISFRLTTRAWKDQLVKDRLVDAVGMPTETTTSARGFVMHIWNLDALKQRLMLSATYSISALR